MADPITNEQLAGKVVEAVTAVQDAEQTVVEEGKKLAAHMKDPNAHGLDVSACIAQGIADHEGNADAHDGLKTALEGQMAEVKKALAGKADKASTYPPSTHTHSPSDLSAAVPVAKGGTGNTTGTAPMATKLATARTISLTGGVVGTASFDGSANMTIAATLANFDASKITSGTVAVARGGTGRTDGKAVALATPRTITLTGDVTGSAGFDGSANAAIATTVANLDTGKITSGTLPLVRGGTGNTTGNAATATKLATARTISLTGDVTGSVGFDGSANVSIAATLVSAGHYHVYLDAMNGTDTKDGKSWANAVKTLNAALRIMSVQADQNTEKILYVKGKISLSSLSLNFGMYRFVGVNDASDVQACFSLTGAITINCAFVKFENMNVTTTSTSSVFITNNAGMLDIRSNSRLTISPSAIAINNKSGDVRVADSFVSGGIYNKAGNMDVRNTQITFNNPSIELFSNIGGYFYIQDNISFLDATGKCFVYSPSGVFAISTGITYTGTFSGMKYDLVGHGLIDTGGRGTSSIAGNRSGAISDYGKVR